MNRNTSSANSGFTLIEIAIVMVIMGLFMSSIFSLLAVYYKTNRHGVTRERLANAETALQAYFEVNGAYPCPASRTIKMPDPMYARAPEKCYEPGKSSFLSTDDDSSLVVKGRADYRVRIGLLPFRSMGIPDAEALDGWGNAIQYAVTEVLTDANQYDQRFGAIDVIAEDGKSRFVPPGTVQYVVFSSGADGMGGYTGGSLAQVSPCEQGLLESENCDDDDATFMDTFSQFKVIPGGGGRNTQKVEYDDLIAYQQYDPKQKTNGQLLFYYRGSCPKNFAPVDIDGFNATGIENLSKYPSFRSKRERGESNVQKLCISTRFSVTMMLTVSGTGQDVYLCPKGWTNIGYKIFGGEGEGEGYGDSSTMNYLICAK